MSHRPSPTLPRPPSSASLRPSASNASLRPSASSASLRTQSRLSQRPGSRLSRPGTRQSMRVLPQIHKLVTQVTGFTADGGDPDAFHAVTDLVTRKLDQVLKQAPSTDMSNADKQIRGYIQKAQINHQNRVAEALSHAYSQLKAKSKALTDLDEDIKLSRLPDHLQFLLALSAPVTSSTTLAAEEYIDRIKNPPSAVPTLTWQDILAEEPFEGQHWEGVYGLPPGSTVEKWETRSGGSTPSLSPWDDSESDEYDREDSRFSFEAEAFETHESFRLPKPPGNVFQAPVDVFKHLQDTEKLRSRQYWREGWQLDANISRPFDLGDASTLEERQVVREVLMCLQNRKNIMVDTSRYPFEVHPHAPCLLHYTEASQKSILASFARTASTLSILRRFTSEVVYKSSDFSPIPISGSQLLSHSTRTRTLEAFSDAIDTQIRLFDAWCASREETIFRATSGLGDPLVISLLSLEKSIRDDFSSLFDVLFSILRRILHLASPRSEPHAVWILADLRSRTPPSVITATILDALLDAVQKQAGMGEHATAQKLLDIFGTTVGPLWAMVGGWLKDGMSTRELWSTGNPRNLDEEFFIEDQELPLLDPDFWSDSYISRTEPEVADNGEFVAPIPGIFRNSVERILNAGKAVGLLRALVYQPAAAEQEGDGDGDGMQQLSVLLAWRRFDEILETFTVGTGGSFDLEMLSYLVRDDIVGYCDASDVRLTRVLTEDCDLFKHMHALQGLYLMVEDDVVGFLDVLFSKMDTSHLWNDFHFLNNAFSETVAARSSGSSKWIESPLVRLSFRGSSSAVPRSVRVFEGLLVEYAVPFPLTYIFTPNVLETYGSILVFLVQVRRAKRLLERIIIRSSVLDAGAREKQLQAELKVFYAMRGKLSWFINTLLNFFTTYVIQAQIRKFREEFRKARSLDQMIRVHGDHLQKIHSLCLLQPNAVSLHKAVISILDMCIHFSDVFISFAGDTTHDTSRLSINIRKHRSRRQARARRNIIGFSLDSPSPMPPSASSDEDTDSEDEREAYSYVEGAERTFDASHVEGADGDEDLSMRLDRMSKELDGLVRFIRRGVEGLISSSGDPSSVLGILAFALEDWDS
ncbi:hypothetical protein CONPUDRAFT_92988 [Coniophora puteana RWD-64-598 SS2]|uniref:Spindle pole body component n=1 Tax=Coniophora puteana (strain RWD-64-598) TaxID=741705 RepID=A0A5M3MBW0_CONPW|nr:uncharacterized protein CONPUDRAFT_92988 [Coniophora puteana RWD-64-598 SS2]EIW76310.1 hypothetical protein CONPUDRAFT_92988 [Coniophora puteana RWD-64-598 SS2]